MSYELKTTVDLDKLMNAANICDLLDEEDCKHIGQTALEGYREDKSSREEWEKRSATALELALQVVKEKSFPWPNCSNVKFPIITVAALQYHARAYPALIDATDLVKARVYGDDPDGQKSARAERISTHMSWQNLEQDPGWEEAHDKGILVQGIAGNAFMKKTFDPTRAANKTVLVLPKDFVINYFTRDIESSPRYTHTYELSFNDIRSREVLGIFRDEDYEGGTNSEKLAESENETPKGPAPDSGPLKEEQDRRQGLREPMVGDTTPYFTGEQYCWWDLDGDGFNEPYIVTFDINSGCVRRIVARFLPSGVKRLNGKVYEIEPVRVFTKIPFIPSPDGGFYDIGLGHLLGPLNESVNTALNQLFDAGTMSTLGGGFLGRGAKIRGGPFSMRPYQYVPVDATGDDIRKSVFPLPVREPSNVLFQVLGLLIQYAERVVGATDIQLGENPGQNTPAETTRTLNENGSRVYNAIYKRTWRALSDEYEIQYELNKHYLSVSQDYFDLSRGKGAMIVEQDYKGPRIYVCPAADPHVVSDTQRVQQATMLVQAAGQLPGINRYQSTLRWLKAMKVPNIDQVYPQPMTQGPDGKPQPAPDFPPPPDPKMLEIQIKQADQQLKQQQFQIDVQKAQIEFQLEIQKTTAEINELNARAEMEIAKAGSTRADPAIKMIYAEIEAAGMRQEKWMRMLELVSNHVTEHKKIVAKASEGNGQATEGMSAPPAVSNAGVLGTLQ